MALAHTKEQIDAAKKSLMELLEGEGFYVKEVELPKRLTFWQRIKSLIKR